MCSGAALCVNLIVISLLSRAAVKLLIRLIVECLAMIGYDLSSNSVNYSLFTDLNSVISCVCFERIAVLIQIERHLRV